jgi:hypothetical protein
MHRPRHSRVIHCLRCAALALVLSRFLMVGAVVSVVLLLVTGEGKWSHAALGMTAGVVVLAILQWICASGGKCPLCTMPVLSRKGCSKHRHARTLAGSHRFPVAFSVLFRGHFRCPYCNEPTQLRLKEPRQPGA